MDPGMTAPHIYNLYPRLAGDTSRWRAHARRAVALGFDSLYLNPIHFPGFSGSCYAVKDFFRVDPALLPEGHPDKHWDEPVRGDGGLAAMTAALHEIRSLGLRPIMDLVINHTARDCPLVHEHPEWYVRDAGGEVRSPSAIDPADARQVTVWGDLAEIDNVESTDRDALWAFWRRVVATWTEAGFEGFRCDAAYKVPAALWRELIATARRVRPRAQFFAETLGARLEEIDALHDAGLDFVFNSSKWWNFSDAWCLEQQQRMPAGWRSVSFAESHDTERLWHECGGRADVVRQRYAFAAGFASGILMPVGFEFGFERRIDVAHTQVGDWEKPHVDLGEFITGVHRARRRIPGLASDAVTAVTRLDAPVLGLEKQADGSVAWMWVNKDLECAHECDTLEAMRGRRVWRVCSESAPADEAAGTMLRLAPAEVVYVG